MSEPGHSVAAQGTVLITGAARRIGRVLAHDFAERGWRVGVHWHRSQAAAEETVREIRAAGGEAAALAADLSDLEAVAALIPACTAALGPPACLVNNASVFFRDEIATLTLCKWTAHFDVNLRAPVFLAKAFAEHLPADVPGNIVNMIDQRVWKLTPQFYSYTLSKAALWTATRTLAQALAPRIRVNAIGPGPVLPSIHQSEAQFARQRQATLLQRGASPEEIAAAVQFILSAPAMTGQMIALDGGQHLAWQTGDVIDTGG